MKNRSLTIRFFRLLILFCGFAYHVNAQTVPVNYVGWYSYNGYHTLNEYNRWALLVEGTIQRNNIIIEPMQWAVRAGLSYEFKNQDRLAGGYAMQYNIPYDVASVPYNALDSRVWEQYSFRVFYKKLSYRLRMEQIWTQQKEAPSYDVTTDWKFQNIMRFRLNYLLPINSKLSADFNDEIFFNMYNLKTQRILNQNRLYAGLIFNLDAAHVWKMNAGYMLQTAFNSTESKEDRKRINNVLRISIISNVSFSKKKTVNKQPEIPVN